MNRDENSLFEDINETADALLKRQQNEMDEPKYIKNIKNRAKVVKRNNPVQLPIWVEGRRGMPNTFLRSALFTCKRVTNERDHHNDMRLPSTSDFEMTYTGLELSQDDEDVYMEIVHRSRFTPLGETVTFSGYEVLKSLGWGTSSRDYKRLQSAIDRLKGGTIKIIQSGIKGYAGSLIRKYAFDEADETGRIKYKIWLEPELVSQFQDDNYTQLRYEQRKQLGKANLSKWLHSYYSSHRTPNAIKTETIRRLSGGEELSLSKFRHKCKESHQRLVEVGFLKKYDYNARSDVFSVNRD